LKPRNYGVTGAGAVVYEERSFFTMSVENPPIGARRFKIRQSPWIDNRDMLTLFLTVFYDSKKEAARQKPENPE
jgi:hypothetical protein